MAMASLTSGLLVRKGHARPSSFKPSSTPFRFENDDAVELLEETHRIAAAQNTQDTLPDASEIQIKQDRPQLQSVEATPAKAAKATVKPAAQAKKPAKAKTTPKAKSQKKAADMSKTQPVARKTIRIRQDLDMTMKIFAARTGTSQKDIIETALANYLEEKRLELDCICGADEL
jgi:hypothetical protein